MRASAIWCLVVVTTSSIHPVLAQSEGEKLQQLFDSEWQRTLRESPTFASRLGDRRYNAQWPDRTPDAIEASKAAERAALEALRAIDVNHLSPAEQLNYRLFEQEYAVGVESQKYNLHLMPLNQRGGIQDESQIADLLTFDALQDYTDWATRLEKFPAYLQQTTDLMREGIRQKMLHPKIVMQRVPAQIRKQIVDNPEHSLYYKPFLKFPDSISEEDAKRVRERARKAIREGIVPGYRRFLRFFEEEYLPASFDEVGCRLRPDGIEMYDHFVRRFTTTDLTADEIHEIGLSEVKRIRAEMEDIQRQVGFEGSFQEFLTHLRTDSQFYFDNPNDLLKAYKECCERIDPELPKLFRRMPKTPYEIVPIPSNMAPDTTTAYYQPPAADGSRPGGYYVNLYRPEVRPIYEIEALSLHESVPGHHFQIALAMELGELPEFRRYGGYTAFIEGWGLYSEKLGEELGLYKDPYSKFGQLTYEMWRAVRLVVDTGMHVKGWTRKEAIDFFAQNTAKSLHDIENEIDRYIAWPGQALAYKIGELRIRALRKEAEEKLGRDFDIREFHDVVLRSGAVPLDILSTHVHAWISERSRSSE